MGGTFVAEGAQDGSRGARRGPLVMLRFPEDGESSAAKTMDGNLPVISTTARAILALAPYRFGKSVLGKPLATSPALPSSLKIKQRSYKLEVI